MSLLAVTFGSLLCGCGKIHIDPASPVVHNAVCDVWPDSIDLHNGVAVRARGDSLLQIRVEGNVLRSIEVQPYGDADFRFVSDYPLLDALCRLDAGSSERVPQYLLPYTLILNPLPASSAADALDRRVKNSYVVPMDTRRYSWPVVNDNGAWIMAGCEVFNAGGNRRWLSRVGEVAEKVVEEDLLVASNPATGLFYGIPRYMAGSDADFPSWMEPADLFSCHTLGVNATYWGALHSLEEITARMAVKNEQSHLPRLPIDADSLLHCINREFWMPATGVYSAMLYGYPLYPLQLSSSDNLAQALAVTSGMASPAIASSLMRRTPASAAGVTTFVPAFSSGFTGGRTLPVTRAIWTVAASVAGSQQVFDDAFSGLLYSMAGALLSDTDPRSNVAGYSLRGVLLRTVAGMRFAFDGIYFAPSVPRGLPGVKRFEHLRYRRALLDIHISGTGNEMKSFRIDGVETTPFFPASAEGKHLVEIELSGNSTASDAAGAICSDVALPGAPMVEWVGERRAKVFPLASTAPKSAATAREQLPASYVNFVYLNGALTGDLLSHDYTLYEAPSLTAVQFVSVMDNKYVGFSSRPHLYAPRRSVSVVNLAQVARGGSKVIQDKMLSARFVESDRGKNRNIAFAFNAPSAGTYVVDVHYLSGLGIVNGRRRTALRSLTVNGVRSGVFVFPQLTSASASADPALDWQSRTAFTNPLKVELDSGRNELEIKLYQPSPVYIDPTANAILADFVRIIRL